MLSAKRTQVLRPGDTCWRLEQATRLQFLIDGSEYFAALHTALLRARHSILILGWDIDSRMTLNPEAADNDQLPSAFGAFLNEIVRRQPRLHAHVLSWDYAVLFALEREWLPRLAWRTHRRLHFRLDKHHPTGASHHQKVVVIDDRVAFVGGLDITRCRWDTPEHKTDDARRIDADGKPYGPFHDVQIIVEGPVAGALGELARERWRRSTGQRLHRRMPPAHARPNTAADESPWPPKLQPALENVEVGVLRTEPAFAGAPAVSELQHFYYSAIDSARTAIFLENQYFSSSALADRLAARLAEPEGPAVVVITPHRESGWLEETTMGVLRARLYRKLKSCDPQQRFRPYCPVLATDTEQCLNVHSKVMTVDDELLTVGSANLSNRSLHLDTECNIALEAATQGDQADAVRAAIAGLRNRLLAEHLNVSVETIDAATREHGLSAAIEALRTDSRSLAPAKIDERPDIDALLADPALVDPMQPLETEYLIDQYLPHEQRRSARGHATLIVLAVLLFGGLAFAWQQTPLHRYLDLATALHFAEQLQSQPLAPLWVLLAYVVAGMAVVPVVLLIAVTAMVFGPWLGVLYAVGGSLLSAAAMYGIGALLGQNTLQRFLKGRLRNLNKQLEQRGVLAVAVIRLMPVAPFTIVNLLAGAARIRLPHFLLGTALGMLPGIVLTSVFIDRIEATLRTPNAGSLAWLGVAVAGIVALAALVKRSLRRRKGRVSRNEKRENNDSTGDAHVPHRAS
jgi:phosphatidylserine/phosphatidylglycerophosphate/cardiolipin synthase-like enzyme/uncharacterized membrane protein YdjX (TVP38/TMEM64 family)